MARGRPKTLPPSRFVGVLVPISMLDKVEDVRREGQKQCSAYSFSEAIRDVLAKGLDVTWKPVQHEEEKKQYDYQEMYSRFAKEVRNHVHNRPRGQHWTTSLKDYMRLQWGDDADGLKMYEDILTVYRGSEGDVYHKEVMDAYLHAWFKAEQQ
jgi:hypothetical protein